MKKNKRGRMENGAANPIDVYVGQRICLRRKSLRLSQGKLAEMLGVTFQQVQKYEKGMNRVSASRLWDLSNILEIPVSFFFYGVTKEDVEKSPAAINGTKIKKYKMRYDPLLDKDIIEMVTAFSKIKNDNLKKKFAR